jgi:hypothetical protein
MAESVYVISAIEPGNGVIGDGFPPGIAITSIVGKSFSLDDAANFVLYLHRCMAGGTQPLEIHWPIADTGKKWALVDDNTPPVVHDWWEVLASAVPFKPFKAKAKMDCPMWQVASKIDIPTNLFMSDPLTRLNDLRVMDVWKVQGNYFVVWPDPTQYTNSNRYVVLGSSCDPA